MGIANTIEQSVSEETNARDWVAAMRAGDFARAWEISDADLSALPKAGADKHVGPRHLQRIWRGEELRGRRVLVRCYHGLGDTIQFIRFMAPLRRMAREVTVWCQPELVSLVANVHGVDRVVALHDGTPEVEFDTDIEIMEAPHALRASMREAAMPRPYLRPKTDLMTEDAGFVPRQERLAVGLVWEGGAWDIRRAVPPALLKEIQAPDVQLYSLQRGEAATAASDIGAIDISTANLNELGCRMRRLDLVISVDTMAAHLAGALGVEAWVMLHSECDWRWPVIGERTYWYPSVRLFHQDVAGDWSGVVGRIRVALQDRLGRYQL
ncbi:conserved hypothetical protein [Bradyrhizobium sp. STM 3843]|uniref:hypothetical protein n=1 Tax=Bradyrhizobium sp. STM 3843 TaxID=551947 RepID=UPI0002403121|nr:hypothetical protein [Bradyrhizobium sp. STM 3843]CCE11284.1 conserved hypothetical protein [Bradyrhizobium sp. STM 3843]